MDVFDSLHGELQSRKIQKRERRGYVQGPIAWQSNKRQKYVCTSCKRTFPRMEVLLQHFRDSSRHSREPISLEASIQMSNWLLAKDQRQHCCPTCCLGFRTAVELFVHLKHTKVHQGTTEAQQAADLLLPKDEARLLRRNLQSSPLACSRSPSCKPQQHDTELQQSPSRLHSPLEAAAGGASVAKLASKHEQQSLPQGKGSCEHSLASSAKDPQTAIHLDRMGQAAADDTQACSGPPKNGGLESQHDANDSGKEPAAMQDCLKVHADAKASQARQGVAKSSVQAASSCSRFHANSLKSLQRRIVAKKRKRRSIAPGAAEEDDSAASSCEVATMTFIEPQSQQAASFVWTDQAKRQC